VAGAVIGDRAKSKRWWAGELLSAGKVIRLVFGQIPFFLHAPP